MATLYIYTNQGWQKESDVLTPRTNNIKKNTKYTPVLENKDLTQRMKRELPMVYVRSKYYFILSVV